MINSAPLNSNVESFLEYVGENVIKYVMEVTKNNLFYPAESNFEVCSNILNENCHKV